MRNLITQLPVALLVAVLITHVTWTTLSIGDSMLWMTGGVLLIAVILAPRSFIELLIIGVLATLAELNVQSSGGAVSPDIFLAVLGAVMFFPKDLLPFDLGSSVARA
ncbi:MAG: hypothetical protein AAGI24_12770 [Pseudomonadota bacterium]